VFKQILTNFKIHKYIILTDYIFFCACMKKNKSITVNINGNEVVLDETEIKFYLSETKKKTVNKSKIEKFFTNLGNIFNKNNESN